MAAGAFFLLKEHNNPDNMFQVSFDGVRFTVRGGSSKGRGRESILMDSMPGTRRIVQPDSRVGMYLVPNTRYHRLRLRQLADHEPLTWAEGAHKAAFDDHNTALVVTGTPTGKPYPHQTQGLSRLRDRTYRALLADDMGLGKSAQALWAWLLSGAPRLLIVCPANIKHKWLHKEIATFAPGFEVTLIDGTPSQRADQFVQARTADIVIANYELLRNLREDHLATLKDVADGNFAILDESHKVKDRNSKRTILTRPLVADAKHVVLLSGTPITNTVADLYTQLSIVEPNLWRGWAEFESRYIRVQEVRLPGRRPFRKAVGVKNERELQGIVDCYQIRRLKKDVLDLPPKIRTAFPIEMDRATAMIYKAMKEWWLYEFRFVSEDEPVFSPIAKTALERALALEEIAQGFVSRVPDSVFRRESSAFGRFAVKVAGRPNCFLFPSAAKIRWLTETLAELSKQGRRAVVWFRFNTPAFWLVQELKDALHLHGALTSAAKHEVVSQFQGGKGGVLLASVRMGEGIDLTSCTDQIFFGRDWSPQVNEQAEDRLHRIGQKGTVNVWIPVVRKTIEEAISERLEAKKGEAELVIDNVGLVIDNTVTVGELREML